MDMFPVLNIITACIRPQNLNQIYDSISTNSEGVRVHWFIVMDNVFRAMPDRKENDNFTFYSRCIKTQHNNSKINYGVEQRNLGLGLVDKGYTYFIDDDTIMHPNFMDVYKRTCITQKPFTVNQQRWDRGEWILKGNNPVPCQIDTCMYCIPIEFIGSIRWEKNTDHHDGVFVNTIWNMHKEHFIFVDEVASYFNYLNRTP